MQEKWITKCNIFKFIWAALICVVHVREANLSSAFDQCLKGSGGQQRCHAQKSLAHLITFSLFEGSRLAFALTSGDLCSGRALDGWALGPLWRQPSSPFGVWLLLLLLTGTFSFVCLSLDVDDIGVALALTMVFVFFLESVNGSSCKGLCWLSLWTCCRCWVSLLWSCLLLIATENDLLNDWPCCCKKFEWGGSRGSK